jgi:hypothetical protein
MPKIPTHEAVLTVKVTPAQKVEIQNAAARLVQHPGVWARDVLVAAAAAVLRNPARRRSARRR